MIHAVKTAVLLATLLFLYIVCGVALTRIAYEAWEPFGVLVGMIAIAVGCALAIQTMIHWEDNHEPPWTTWLREWAESHDDEEVQQ